VTLRLQHATLFLSVVLATGALGCDEANQATEPTPVCSLTISSASQTFPSDGGTATVQVTASAASCTWTAAASASWITILEGATGTGSGSVKYSVAANPATDDRTSALLIGGQAHEVKQHGRTPPTVCSYSIAPTGASVGSDGGTGSVDVTAPAACSWTATSTASWLMVTGGSQGVGDGKVSYTVDRNGDTATRTAALTIADKTFTVIQSGQTLVCEYSISPVAFSPCMPGGTLSVTMTTQASCPWTASSNASWLVITAGESGSGPGAIRFSFPDNYDAPREALLMVRWPSPTAGQNVRVSQAGCRYGVSKSAIGFTSAGGSGTFDVLQESDPYTCGGALQDQCVWTAVSGASWITITSSMPRAGDNPVFFTVAANDSTAPRASTITVRDKVIQITQAGR
jgi:hypothetical protein